MSDSGGLSLRARMGRQARIHESANLRKSRMPHTPNTDMANPAEKADAGDHASIARTAADAAANPSPRRPLPHAIKPTTATRQPRTTEGRKAVIVAKHASSTQTATPRGRRLTRASTSTASASAAITSRCTPDAATRCATPLVRYSASAGVPAILVVSPSRTPDSSAEPGPSISPSCDRAHARTGPASPGASSPQRTFSTRRTRTWATIPPRCCCRERSSSPLVFTTP